MSEIEEPAGTAPRRVIGTPSPAPVAVDTAEKPAGPPLVTDPPDKAHASRAELLVAALFVLAFLAGCGFIAAYIGLEVGSSNLPPGANAVDAAFRSNLALAVVLLALGAGSMIWVRHLTPNIEIEEERHELKSAPGDRAAFKAEFADGAAISQVTKRPLLRGTSLRYTVWRKGLRAVTLGALNPLRPGDFQPGSMITMIPEGFQDNPDALAKAGVILIKFEPGQLNFPDRYNGSTLIASMNWTIDNSLVAYSKICTHVGCPVALYEQTTHHILCPCHQSTFDATNGAWVIFGPAARPLPQLPLMVDSDGYLAAASDFPQPVGPSFWERG